MHFKHVIGWAETNGINLQEFDTFALHASHSAIANHSEMEPPVTIITLGTRRYRKITPESAVAGSRRRPAVRRVDPEEEEEHEDGGCCPPEAVGEDEVAQNDQEQDKEKESDAPAESKQETIQHQYNVRKQGQDFVLAESIPEEFYGRIIGKGGSNLRDVQAATGCRLFIPRNAGQTFQIRGPTGECGHTRWFQYASLSFKQCAARRADSLQCNGTHGIMEGLLLHCRLKRLCRLPSCP